MQSFFNSKKQIVIPISLILLTIIYVIFKFTICEHCAVTPLENGGIIIIHSVNNIHYDVTLETISIVASCLTIMIVWILGQFYSTKPISVNRMIYLAMCILAISLIAITGESICIEEIEYEFMKDEDTLVMVMSHLGKTYFLTQFWLLSVEIVQLIVGGALLGLSFIPMCREKLKAQNEFTKGTEQIE